MAPKKRKEKIPAPGAKGEKSTSFYTKKKWRSMLQYSKLELAGRNLDPRGTLIIGTALLKNRYVNKLDLSNNQIGDDGAIVLADILRNNALIQSLNLSHNGITDIGGIALASAFIPNVSPSGQPGQWNRTLFSLILLGNSLGDDSLLAFSNAAACHRDLTAVDLSWNQVGPQGTKCLMRCFQRNPLCNFLLAANHIGDEGTEHLCDAIQRYGGRSQTTINLYRNDISHRGAEALGRLLSSSDVVQEVNLCGNTLGLKGMQALRRHLLLSSSSCTLRTLNLADNLLGDEGAKEVADIIKADLPVLERLDISDNNITDKGAVLIAKALKANSKLQVVNCQGNSFGNKSVAAVEDLVRETKTLKSLNLSNCIESMDQKRILTLVVGESAGVHVELGQDADADEDGNVYSKLEEHLQILADQEAQLRAKEAEKKKLKKKRRATAA